MPADPCAPPSATKPFPVKGAPVLAFRGQQLNALSDEAIDCSDFNAITVQVIVTGTTPTATVSVEGAAERGGNNLPLPDLNASQSAVTTSRHFDVIVGSRWVRIRLASLSGTFKSGQGFTVLVTPYVSPGSARVAASIVVDTLAAIQVLTGALTISGVCSIGTAGGIYQGTGSFATPTTGLKIWNEAGVGRISGYNGGQLQWYADTDGRLYAGAGAVTIDSLGVSLLSGAAVSVGDPPNPIEVKWLNPTGSAPNARIFATQDDGALRLMGIGAAPDIEAHIFYPESSPLEKGSLRLSYSSITDLTRLGIYQGASRLLAEIVSDGVTDYLQVGQSPAASGILRLPNAKWIAGKNAAGDGDVNMLQVDSSNRVAFGAGAFGTPSTQAFSDSALTGSGPTVAASDHKHAMPANPVSYATPSIALGSAAAAGAAATLLRSDATIAAFDTTDPSTQAFSDAAAVGSAAYAARRDHKHAMPADPTAGAWSTWNPTLSAVSPMTFTNTSVTVARYKQVGKTVYFLIEASGTTGGTAGPSLTFTLPVAAQGVYGTFGARVYLGSGASIAGFCILSSSTLVVIRRYDSTNFPLAAGVSFTISGVYEAV